MLKNMFNWRFFFKLRIKKFLIIFFLLALSSCSFVRSTDLQKMQQEIYSKIETQEENITNTLKDDFQTNLKTVKKDLNTELMALEKELLSLKNDLNLKVNNLQEELNLLKREERGIEKKINNSLKQDLPENFVPNGEIPILMYHYIRDVDPETDRMGYNLSMNINGFTEQIAWLAQENFKTTNIANILSEKLKPKTVILTFDDGYQDFYEQAFPVLKKYNFTASVAVIVDKIGKPGFMGLTEIQEIVDYGIEILSHTMSSPDLRNLNLGDLEYELKNSKSSLEDLLKIPVWGFVYPSGRYNDQVVAITKKHYKIALSVRPGLADLSENLFILRRIRVDNRLTFGAFKNYLNSSF